MSSIYENAKDEMDDEEITNEKLSSILADNLNIDSISEAFESVEEARGLTPDEVRMALTVPEIAPCQFDTTIDFWLERIAFWGELDIRYQAPGKLTKSKVTKSQALDIIISDSTYKQLGLWDFKKTGFNSLVMTRTFRGGLFNRKQTEKLFINIKLHDDIKQAIKGKF